MNIEKISFSKNNQILAAFVNKETALACAVEALKLNIKRPVVVVVGGAGKVDNHHQEIIKQSARSIAKAAAKSGAIVLSGGTNAGVMAAVGQARVEGKYNFPLVGVAARKLVTWPGDDFRQKEEAAPLEPNHTHFLMVPGNQWGDESFWIARLATLLAGPYQSVTVLSNGGKISLKDVLLSIKAKRPVIILAGTGRLANELAETQTPSDLIKITPARDEKAVFKVVWESVATSPKLGGAVISTGTNYLNKNINVAATSSKF